MDVHESTTERPNQDQVFAYSINDAAQVAGIGRTTLYDEIRTGRLNARKAGRRTLILREDLQAWLAALPARQPAGLTSQAA